MKSAAIRLRGSSALPFLAAVRRNAERVASAASCVLRCTTDPTAKAGSSRASEAGRVPPCGLIAAERGAQVPLVRALVGRQTLQIADQVERLAGRVGPLQRVPAEPHDEVGAAAALRTEALQHRSPGVIAIADADFAWVRGATLERFGAVLVGQFEMREPAAAEVKHAVHAPVRADAARLADAGAVS